MTQQASLAFPDFTIATAPPAARRGMTATEKHLGYLPVAMARMAGSPHLLDGFMKLSTIFDSSTLSPLARETLVMTVAARNGCHLCLAMHTARLTALGADASLIASLRGAEPLVDPALVDPVLEAVREFTLHVLDTAGDASDEALDAFMAAGYTSQNALEVVLGIGTYTMSTFANRLTRAPIDDQLSAFA